MIEEDFHNNICSYLKENFRYRVLSAIDIADKEFYFVESHLTEFIQATQLETWNTLHDEYFGSDTARQILKAITEELQVSPLWLIIRNGIEVKGKRIYLYSPRPRNNQHTEQANDFKRNIFAYKKEFYFDRDSSTELDLR